jgi:hypothetical protein
MKQILTGVMPGDVNKNPAVKPAGSLLIHDLLKHPDQFIF